jgi:histidine triad (HIT) family protein
LSKIGILKGADMDECLFCKIIQGNIPCARVYETEEVLAFLDIAPVNKGHTLIIPKNHYATLWELPQEIGSQLLQAMQLVGKAIMSATSASGLNIGMNNYRAAGQLVDHAHWHLIPRFQGDGLELWPQGGYASQEEMDQLAKDIKDKIV